MGLGEVSGVIGRLKNEGSLSLLQALSILQAQGAPGMGQAVPVHIGVLSSSREPGEAVL